MKHFILATIFSLAIALSFIFIKLDKSKKEKPVEAVELKIPKIYSTISETLYDSSTNTEFTITYPDTILAQKQEKITVGSLITMDEMLKYGPGTISYTTVDGRLINSHGTLDQAKIVYANTLTTYSYFCGNKISTCSTAHIEQVKKTWPVAVMIYQDTIQINNKITSSGFTWKSEPIERRFDVILNHP